MSRGLPPTPLLGAAVALAFLAGVAARPSPQQPECDSWSQWARFTLERGSDFAAMFQRRNVEVWMTARWRACDAATDPDVGPMVGIHFEFKNPNGQRVYFNYRMYNRIRRTCPAKGERPGDDNGSDELSRLAWGSTDLDPGETTDRKHVIPLASYDGFVWPCAWFVKVG